MLCNVANSKKLFITMRKMANFVYSTAQPTEYSN